LLVGKTAAGIANAGSEFSSTGRAFFTFDNGGPLQLNRLNGNGDIIELHKDGVEVGSIGTPFTGELYIEAAGANSSGLLFTSGNSIQPRKNSAADDGNITIGASGNRFKDLYLSGTIEIENGTGNVGVGKQALNSNTANNNTAVGYQAGYTQTTSGDSTYLGYQAGYSRTGSGNTCIGNYSGRDGTTGTDNTLVGRNSGYTILSGSKNTIIGMYNGNQGGLDIRTSSNNIVLSDGDGNPRLYIDSSGNAAVGSTSALPISDQVDGVAIRADGSLQASRNNADPAAFARRGTDGDIVKFFKNGGSVGSISVTSSATAYNTSSDHRLKENVVDLTGATTRLKQLEPKRFNFIVDADTTVDGFLAHEVQTVVPEAITGTHNEVDADGNPVYQGIDQSKLVPLLVATIKELEARITALENA
jgi:hypothetical protein